MSAWTQLIEPGPALLVLVLAVTSQVVSGAPLDDVEQSSEIEYYPVADATGCYYNFEHYDEGDRIITNEPCLNCTCHNRMLMCYLRVCPFTKAIGQDCKVAKKADQCCPVITCPEVPVQLLPSASTTPSTAIGHLNEYGCSIDNLFYADGAKVPSNPNNPCEVCYCIRNKTACIIQECTLTGKVVEGCLPVYVDGVCCPVRYDCDHPEIETTPRPLLTTTTTNLPPTNAPTDCIYNNEVYADGALVKKDVPCEQCYCMRGDIVCAVQECGPTPLDKVNCTALPTKEGQCCPDTYECENISEEDLTTLTYYEAPTTQPTEILPGKSSTPSETEEAATTQSEQETEKAATTQSEQETVEASTIPGELKQTEKPVTESEAEGVQPVTESATIESFTSRITEAITSRVTDIVEALTTAISGSEQETTTQPESQTSEAELTATTAKTQIAEQEPITQGATKPELDVTERISQQTTSPEVQDHGVTEPEIVHDDHEEESPHEEENEIFEGSGKPVEEQPTSSATVVPESEEKHVSKEHPTTQKIEDELITEEHVTEEGSGLPEERPGEQQTTQAQVEEGLQTTTPLEPDSHVKDTVPPQTEIGETTESLQEKLHTTQEPPVTDAEAQETIQPLEPERSTEQARPEKVHPDISLEPVDKVTEEIVTEQQQEKLTTTENIQETAKPTEKDGEIIPAVTESQTTVKSEGEGTEPSATNEPETEPEKVTTVEEQKPETDDEGKSVTTTEREELEIVTEVPTKETERPESMDHISETASPESETEINVTEKSIDKEAGEKEMHTTEAEQPATGQPQLSEEKTDVSVTEASEMCDDKGCKSKQDEKEVPGIIEESCTKEGCKPLEQIPTSIPGETIPGEKEKPSVEDCSNEQGCISRIPDKETEIPASEQTPEETGKITPVPESATQCENEHECKTLPVDSGLQKLTTEATTDEAVLGTTKEPEEESKPEQPEGSGEEPTAATEQTVPEEYEPTTKPKDQTQQALGGEDESKLVPTEGILAETTIKSDIEKEADMTPASESITSLPKESTSEETTAFEISEEKQTESPQEIATVTPQEGTPEESTPAEISKDKETEIPQEVTVSPNSSETTVTPKAPQETTTSEVSEDKETESPQDVTVSPISSEVTVTPKESTVEEATPSEISKDKETESPQETTIAPELVTVGTTVHQNVEIPSYTVPPEGGKLTEQSETFIPETTEQTSKETQTDSAYPATESVMDSTHENIVEPESITPAVSPVTEISDSQMAEGTTQPQIEESHATSVVEDTQTTESGTKLPEGAETVTPAFTKTPSETTEPVPETQTQQVSKVSEEPSSEAPILEHTVVPEQGGKTPPLEITQSPEIFETPISTQQPESEGIETTEHVSPHETLPSSETSEKSSEETPAETETPVFVTEPETEVTSESEEEHGIPGEGSCLVDGQTYKNNSQVPPINQCQASCKCISSILQCESIPCAPPPSNLQCSPIFHSPDACCPVYSCSVPGVTSMESDSHVVETTTAGEEILMTGTAPSEESATSEVITEKEPSVTTSKSILGASQTTTQKEVGTETATVPVTESATKEEPTEQTQTIVPVKHTTSVSEETTKPNEEQLPSRDEIENEISVDYPEHCGSEGCAVEEKVPDTTVSSVTQPEESISEPTESIKPEDEEILTQPTENVIPDKPAEGEPQKSITEQEEAKEDEITRQTTPAESPAEIATETTDIEESSKTPEEIAAAPEMEEAVTTPSVLTETATDAILNQISKDTEDTTDKEIVTEGKIQVTASDKSVTRTETDLTVRPLVTETTISGEVQPTEGLEATHEPTLPSAVPTDHHVETTPTPETGTDELIHEHVTEIDTTSPLESEAHVTETSDKESEKPKDFTEVPTHVTEKSDNETEKPEQTTEIPVHVTEPLVHEEENVTKLPVHVTDTAEPESSTEIDQQVTEIPEKETEMPDHLTETQVTDLPSKESDKPVSITESPVTEAADKDSELPAITEVPVEVTESVEKEGITEVPAVTAAEVTEKESEQSETELPEKVTEKPGVSEVPVQVTEAAEKEGEQPEIVTEIPEKSIETETMEGVTETITEFPEQVTKAIEKETDMPETVPEIHEKVTETVEQESEKPESVTEIGEVPAQATQVSEKGDEGPKDFTESPATEIVPEGTSHPLEEEPTATVAEDTISPETERSPEDLITQQVFTTEQQPSKTTVSGADEVTTVETITPQSVTSKPKSEEALPEVTETPEQPQVATTERSEEETATELGEFPTHASIPTDTTETEKIVPVTESKEGEVTTGVPTLAEGEEHATSTEGLLSSKPTEESLVTKSEEPITIDKEESVYTAPQLTTQTPVNDTGLYTSGPQEELSTKKSVEGELSTSVPVTPISTSTPSTASPTYAPAPAPGHDIPGEQVPDLPDYHSPGDDYEDEDQSPLGPGTCRYGGKVYVSAQQIPRDDPCDFCFCFRSDIICLQQSCPPPIPRCHEEPIRGFCCPRYECPVGMATAVNVTTSTTTTTTTLPPHFFSHAYTGRVSKSGCQIKGRAYKVGEVIPSASGPCLHCTCGGDGEMKCDPKACSPEPMLRQMIAAAASRRRR